MRYAGLLWLAAAGMAQAAEAVPVPSGQEVYFDEVISTQPGPGLVYRFRFVAPAIAQGSSEMPFETVANDMEHLCNSYALPRIPTIGPQPAQIVISVSDRQLAFGEAAPEATQFFEAYRIEGDTCIWEYF